MIVIVAGMPRSGSTFSFNVVREILQSLGSTAWASDNRMPPLGRLTASAHFVLKSHHPDEEIRSMIADGRAKAICTHRKPEDAIASWSQTFGFSLAESIETVASWIAWHSELAGRMLNLPYEQVEGDPAAAIDRIAAWLGVEWSVERRSELLAKYDKRAVFERVSRMEKDESTVDLGFSYYDPESFFHRRHVRSVEPLGAASVLSETAVAEIRTVLAAYLSDGGEYRPVG
ncbi:sulfotransferase family protein [Ideonella sp. BN130291]|uniref:sulfotransferase family protein n=1 Tax=Ideonella sp. BN130291 TaxID=3112940 RepID=UPI002E27523E|nr:sulfotransferase [Ideonella sp. BN130291]